MKCLGLQEPGPLQAFVFFVVGSEILGFGEQKMCEVFVEVEGLIGLL